MNKKIILGVAAVALVLGGAIGARIAIAPKGVNGPAISIYVGNEDGNAEFYQELIDNYIAERNEAEPGSFPYQAKVSGVDLGSIASSILNDRSAHADIYSVANDNVGKLAQHGDAWPITDQGLINQVSEDNTAAVVNVCESTVGEQKDLYGVPYISQALFLMYDKRYVSATQAESFEGLAQAAQARGENVKGVEVVGDDGFNFSFVQLSRQLPENTTTLKIYANGTNKDGTYCQGDDTVTATQWARDFLANPNGLGFPSSSKWDGDLKAGNCVSIIGGAWHYNTFAKAIGSTNVGTALIPTYTVSASQAYGSIQPGTTFRGGTFADVKVFMMNKAADEAKLPYLQELMTFLSKKTTQQESFITAGNIPAYASFAQDIDAIKAEHPDLPEKSIDLALAQTGMVTYGLPQPFATALLNNFYYQNGGPAIFKELIVNKDGAYSNVDDVRMGLWRLNYLWSNGVKNKTTPELSELPMANPYDPKPAQYR